MAVVREQYVKSYVKSCDVPSVLAWLVREMRLQGKGRKEGEGEIVLIIPGKVTAGAVHSAYAITSVAFNISSFLSCISC